MFNPIALYDIQDRLAQQSEKPLKSVEVEAGSLEYRMETCRLLTNECMGRGIHSSVYSPSEELFPDENYLLDLQDGNAIYKR